MKEAKQRAKSQFMELKVLNELHKQLIENGSNQTAKRDNQHSDSYDSSSMPEYQRILIFEIIGTAIISYGVHSHDGKSLLMALFVFAAIQLTCQFSGGHLNPAVTFCFYLRQHGGINKSQAVFYLLGQLIGAFIGIFLGQLILGENNMAPQAAQQEFNWQLADFVGEILGTFVFILCIQIQCDPITKVSSDRFNGIMFMMVGFMIGQQATNHSGGVMNPAIAISQNLYLSLKNWSMSRFSGIWVITLGPLLGGYFSSQFFDNVYYPIYVDVEKQKSEGLV